MNASDFCAYLRTLNISLSAEGERLIIHAPKKTLTPELYSQLNSLKPELLAHLRKNIGAPHNGVFSAIPPVPRDRDLPVSFAQQRLWFLNQLEPESPAYNQLRALHLQGPLDAGAFREALDGIVNRHEVLRTTFIPVDGGPPVQSIGSGRSVDLQLIDLAGYPDDEREAEQQRQIAEMRKRPFDLSRDLLLRAALLRLAEQEHLLLIATHHIASDAWSRGILFRELGALYEAISKGKPNPLTPLSIQYADFAVWQRNWLQGEVLETQLSYWKRQLENVPILQLPTDRPHGAVEISSGAKESFALSKELSQALKRLSREQGVTLFMTLLAAFQTLLHRYSGQDDIAVGSPIANRTRPEIEGLIGFFVNTLVLRTDLSGNPSFRELLARVRKVALDAYEHQDLPFEKLVEELNPERSLGSTPLFQVLFVLEHVSERALELPGLTVHPVSGQNDTAKFDLILFIADEQKGLRVLFEYSTDLFDKATIERMIGHFHKLLKGIAADPDQRVSDLQLLSRAERHQLLVEWNETDRDYPKDGCVHRLFEAQAERTPDAVAVVFEDQQLTYRQLNRRANQLAHYLRKLRVGPDVLVGICMERSLEMVVGLLAILKAGGAYVPLDPAYPKERLTFMLGDTQVPVLLTQQPVVENLPPYRGRTVCLDTGWDSIAREGEENPVSGVTAENLIYVLFTSGSTGKPKAVAMSHRPVCNLLSWQLTNFRPPIGRRTLQFASLSFDVSFQEIFSSFCSGGTLVMISEELRRDPAALLRLLEAKSVERLFLPFIALQQLAETAERDKSVPPSLREVITAGEPLQITRQIKSFFDRLENCHLYNQYGPSESHVVTSFTVTDSPRPWSRLPSIGRPIANTRIYLLDERLQPVPIGVPGELHIGGSCLARGYLNRPDLTAEKFIDHPFSNESGARLYKTGDLARYMTDGNIEFLGRVDRQVKLRGFRIEPGEIESVLGEHPAIRETVVSLREDTPGDKRLVAYVVSRKEQVCTTSELRNFLKQKLPDYMVPSAFVFLDGLPLTPSGKIDRKSLPRPSQGRPELEQALVAPRTPVEELIATTWAEVLKLDKIGIDDNFFALGGHSLMATQVVSRMRESFKLDLPLRVLFERPTVSRLAEHVEEGRRNAQGIQAPPLVALSRVADLPLSFAQQRLWFLDQLEPESALYNVPGALRISGSLDVGALQRSIEEIVRRHAALRTVFSKEDGKPAQRILSSLKLPLPVEDLSGLNENEREAAVQRRAAAESQTPFDLARGPLVRVRMLRLAREDHVLLLTMHHIVSDGWSVGILFRELSTLYEAFTRGKPSPLNDLTVQYADFAAWQRDWLQGDVLERQLSYWKAKLEGAATLELPVDHPRPAVRSSQGGRRSFVLNKTVTDGLRTLSHRENATLFMTLLAAFQLLLHRYTSQDDIVVGSPIAGRTRPEIEDLIGFFVNTLVLRNDFSGNPTFRETLRHVKQVCLDAYTHQDVPFEKLVEELHPERSLSQNPLFQVMFVLQNAPAEALRFGDAEIAPLGRDIQQAKFDLTLSIREEAETLRAVLNYRTDIFDGATIERMLGHFQVLLEGIVADPERPISDLPMITEAEKNQLLVEWNDTKKDYPTDKCVHQLFEAQVGRTPDAVAVVLEDQSLTYRQLNARANQLAHYLKKHEVGQEMLVAICVERSLEMVVGLLAVLKAGAAYVPLDPDYPKERLAFMLEDSHASLVLTQPGLMEKFRLLGTKVVSLDTEWETFLAESDENPGDGAQAESLAFVMYTSGTTGTPKGVMIAHRSLVNYLCWFNESPLVENLEILPFIAKPTFDASLKQIFAPLLRGGQVWIPSDAIIKDHAGLQKMIGARTGAGLNCVPALWQAMLDALEDDGATAPKENLSSLFLGGERLDQQLVDRTFRALPHTKIWNLYGPTETTANAIVGRICPEGLLTLGRPIANIRIYILDSALRPVPIGVPGEIHIGGAGVARGYLNRHELTVEKFILDPFSDDPAARLYKSGDLARYLPDGNIQFIGRNDHQVKIRGFRIEPGEIETLLREHAAVRDAVVIAREDAPGDKRLVGYVVPHKEQTPTTTDLRNLLKSKLPDYMVPSAFVLLDKLPLMPNGKVDRNALPAPDQNRAVSDAGYVAPRTLVEELLAEIWAGVLKLEKVGVHDNFFDLGGHSLLATQVVSRIRESLQVEFPLRVLFEKPTVGGLAEQVEEARRKEHGLQARPLLPVSRERPMPLSYAQQRLWFLDLLQPNSFTYNLPSRRRLKGTLDVAVLQRSLEEILKRHEALRTIFKTIDGTPFQVVRQESILPLPVVDLSDRSGPEREDEVRRLVADEARKPFDLTRGPLLRAKLLRLSGEDHILLVTMHHIVSDGWSMEIFFRELSVLYETFSKGRPSPLPELPVQYPDYAVWQRDWLQGEILESQLSYWRNQLRNVPTLALPTDRPRPPVQGFAGASESLVIDKDLSAALKSLCRRQRVTLFMMLVAGFQALLHRYTGEEDIVVGCPIAGRIRPEVEGLIGFFLNTLVLRTDVSGDPTFSALLARVRDTALAAYANQDVPFEKLLEELRPERDLSRSPLFQVFFNMINTGARRFEMHGLQVEDVPGEGIGSKFDLTIYVSERGNEIQLRLVYSSSLFDPNRMAELLQQYKQLLAQIVEQPERPISSYSLLTPTGTKLLPDPVEKLSSDWMGAVHERFARQAESSPEHPAITDPRDTWNYRELNARSNQLAHYLLAHGIQREEVVAIYGHRSAAIALAVLGVLKSGAAFLILDPGYPAARLSEYVKAAGPRGLIQLEPAGPLPEELEQSLNATVRCRITLPGQKSGWTEGSLKRHSTENPAIAVGPDDLACISFTSGSTGGPKGILGRHGPLSHFLPWQAGKFCLTAADRFSMLSGLSHDPLQREIFTPLWIGASIHVPAVDDIGAPGRLGRWMAREKITFAHLTPALGRLLTQGTDHDCRLSSLRQAFFVGDKLTWADVDSLRRIAPAVQCINYYGSTETQRAVSYYEVPSTPVDGSQKAVLPVGRGMPDVQLLVLNQQSALAGIGELGEIHMRSPHLARGYLGDENLTRARFVVNPFNGDRTARLYKTGDVGRYLPDGNVEILGRNDGQIKLRGLRIEPAEIETALTRHPDVREAVVTVYDNSIRDRELAAYLVLQQAAALPVEELRAFLRIRLPDYMVPSVFVFLDALPLTPNGKVDYRALPDPQSHGEGGRAEYVAARDEAERVLCRVWSEVLGIDRVGLDDNFFAVGGHSLLAARLFARLDETFGHSLPLSVLFKAPTVRLLAEHYRTRRLSETRSAVVALTDGGTLPPIFAAPGVFGNVICFASLARELGSAHTFYGLQAIGLDGAEVPFDSIEQMAKRYLNEIREVQPRGPYTLIGACFGATVAYEMARQLLETGETVAFLGLLDPTRREGYETNENRRRMPRIVNQARAFTNFLAERLRLYRGEMRGLGTGSRIQFLLKKLRSLSFTVGDGKAFTRVQREIYQHDVVRANIRALDGYHRKPLNGKLRAVEIFETSHPRNTTAWSLDWKTLWDGDPVHHRVAGKDSGDMLTGKNGRILAAVLRERLKKAVAENGLERAAP